MLQKGLVTSEQMILRVKSNLPTYEKKMAVFGNFSGNRSGVWLGFWTESIVLPEPGQRRKTGYEGRGARIE